MVSVGLSLVTGIKLGANSQLVSWILLWVGTLKTFVASIAGVNSHFVYETTALGDVIETHQK